MRATSSISTNDIAKQKSEQTSEQKSEPPIKDEKHFSGHTNKGISQRPVGLPHQI